MASVDGPPWSLRASVVFTRALAFPSASPRLRREAMRTLDDCRTSARRARALWLAAAAVAGGGCSGDDPPPDLHPLPSYCSGEDISSLTLPWYWERTESPTFPYRYQLKTAADPAAPVIVALPGGPGGTSINDRPVDATDSTYASIGAIPAHYSVVFTDPRGSGCNASTGSEFPLDFFSTDYLARDVLEVIRSLGLTNYYLYGRSYGTVHATYLAHLIESLGYTPPRGVVLEGGVGRAFVDWNDYLSGLQAQWTRVRGLIAPGVLDDVLNTPDYLGYSSQQWAHLIGATLEFGGIPHRGEYVALLLDPLALPDSDAGRTSLALIDALVGDVRPKPRIVTALGCRELWSTLADYDLVDGAIVPQGDDSCSAAGLTMDRAYDAAAFPLHVPIFYFHGDNDSAAPWSGARYHFDVQTATTRRFVTVSGTSHHPLDMALKSLACTTAIWDSIVWDPAGLDASLATCGWTVTLDSAP
jgi:pimeloyl-ACP methyl ester carboxylesterase